MQRNYRSVGNFMPEPPESSITTLVSMGFESNAARQALIQARNDINVATNILLEAQSQWLETLSGLLENVTLSYMDGILTQLTTFIQEKEEPIEFPLVLALHPSMPIDSGFSNSLALAVNRIHQCFTLILYIEKHLQIYLHSILSLYKMLKNQLWSNHDVNSLRFRTQSLLLNIYITHFLLH